MREVTLDTKLCELAYHIALARELSAQLIGRTAAHGAAASGSSGSLETQIVGARPEVAFWEMTGRECRINAVILVPNLRDLDGDAIWRGHSFEIRGTDYANGHLIVHPPDPPERFYVLCIAEHPVYRFPGYIRGFEAKTDAYLRDPDPRGERNFWIPQSDLIAWRS